MSRFVNKILREAEDSTDDFFQSKHINKRKEEFKKQIEKEKYEAFFKLFEGLKIVKIADRHKTWKSDEEKLFLELFSKLHVDKEFYEDDYIYGCYLLDESNDKKCLYDIKTRNFFIRYDFFWSTSETIFMNQYYYVRKFVERMLRKYFNLYNVTANGITGGPFLD